MNRVYLMELVRSFQCGYLTRRQFMGSASRALGSAAAASLLLSACARMEDTPPPVLEEGGTPSDALTPPAGLVTETASYPGTDGETLMGYLAHPAQAEGMPGVIVIQEWWGLNDHIQDVTNRFAQEGFVALAPDLYHGKVATEPDEARKLVMELDMAAAVVEIQQAVAYLLTQPSVAGPTVGVVGFCMGGRLALATARTEEKLGAVVVFYGTPLTPAQVKEVKAPLLGLYGANDQGIPVAQVESMRGALESEGIEHEVIVYEGADHAFFNDTRASYHPDAAENAWLRTLAWFRDHL